MPSVERANEVIDAHVQAEKLICCRVVRCGRVKRRGGVSWSTGGQTEDSDFMLISEGGAATDA